MKTAWGFPGQGAQRKGMGEALFARYPALVEAADAVLCYSLRTLCLEDPEGTLGQTRFTQPALFAVSALDCLARREDGQEAPDVYIGHSLGEFVALFAAGAFDFETGIAIVAKRGELMTRAPRGAMAALIGLDEARIREIIAGSTFDRIEIANINAQTQIVISGDHEQIGASAPLFTQVGARHVRLDVSAAFHSSFMRDAELEFSEFLKTIELRPLQTDVIANCTARPYPRTDYADLISRQITHPVRWYESVSWLLANGLQRFDEVGPGEVLTGLYARIRKAPMAIAPVATARAAVLSRPQQVFMYPDFGAQYPAMGRELYRTHAVFREHFDACDALYARLCDGRRMADVLFDDGEHDELSEISVSLPALFAIGHALTAVLRDAGHMPDAVLGCGVGEFVASVVAGALSVDDAMTQLVRVAGLVRDRLPAGGLMAVHTSPILLRNEPALVAGCEIAGVHFDGHLLLSGSVQALREARERLRARGVLAVTLPASHALHTDALDAVADAFFEGFRELQIPPPGLPVYSAAIGGQIERIDAAHLWRALRSPLAFDAAIESLRGTVACRFVDLGPSGDLGSFIRHGHRGQGEVSIALDRFGRDATMMSRLLMELAA